MSQISNEGSWYSRVNLVSHGGSEYHGNESFEVERGPKVFLVAFDVAYHQLAMTKQQQCHCKT